MHGSAASVRFVMVVPEIPTAHPYLRFRSDDGISPGYLSIYGSVLSRHLGSKLHLPIEERKRETDKQEICKCASKLRGECGRPGVAFFPSANLNFMGRARTAH